MKWSKLRKELELRLAKPLQGRLSYHLTTYENSTGYLGRAWITWDGEQLVNFSNQDTWNAFESYSNASCQTGYLPHPPVEKRDWETTMEKGEFSKYDFAETEYHFLQLSIEECLQSSNPILRLLAVVDKRVGKRRIRMMKAHEKHPLIIQFIGIREKSSLQYPSQQ